MDLSRFNINIEEELQSDFVDPGTHNMVVSNLSVEVMDKGERLEVEFSCVDPSNAGKLVKERYWLSHENPKARDAGIGNLCKLLKAAGFDGEFSDLNKLLAKKVSVTVQLREYNGKNYRQVEKVEPFKTVKKEEISDIPF